MLDKLKEAKTRHDELSSEIDRVRATVQPPSTKDYVFCTHLHYNLVTVSGWYRDEGTEGMATFNIDEMGLVMVVDPGIYTPGQLLAMMDNLIRWVHNR